MKDTQLSQIQNAASRAGTDNDRRRLLASLSVALGASAMGASAEDAKADSESMPMPRCALTRRDESGKSVFRSFDVTPQVVTFESRQGLVFWVRPTSRSHGARFAASA